MVGYRGQRTETGMTATTHRTLGALLRVVLLLVIAAEINTVRIALTDPSRYVATFPGATGPMFFATLATSLAAGLNAVLIWFRHALGHRPQRPHRLVVDSDDRAGSRPRKLSVGRAEYLRRDDPAADDSVASGRSSFKAPRKLTTRPTPAAEVPVIRMLTVGPGAPAGLVTRTRHGDGDHETYRAVGFELLLICNSTIIAIHLP